MMDWMLKDCVLAISLTKMTANSLSRLLSWIPIIVIPNGVPPQPAFLSTNSREGRTRVLYLSNLMERKGYRDLLTAAQIITASMDDVEVLVAGGWFGAQERRTGQAIVAGAKHPDRIKFMGEVSGLRRSELLGQSDIFVFPPTRPEGQGLVLLEAMSAGLPIVATDIGPMRETLDPSCSILVEPSDPHALAGAIATLVRDAELRRRMGAAAKLRYQNHFSAQRSTSELLNALSNQFYGVLFPSVQT
jgi:glycosyltransferase involved in cell wall biosynthesis